MLKQVEGTPTDERTQDDDQSDAYSRSGSSPRRRASWAAAKPPTTMPTAIISPCQATVIGPISIVGSMPIVITDGTALTFVAP